MPPIYRDLGPVSGRTAERRDVFDVPQRLQLVEGDLDEHDDVHREIRSELAKIKGILIGLLVSIATAAVLLAINLAVTGA